MSLNIAVIGVGRWGRNHVRVLSSLQGDAVNRLIVVDVDPSRAKEIASLYGADAYYDNVEDLVSREKDLDAAVVTVPTVHHYSVVKSLIERCDVFVEKPLAETPEQGYDLLKAAFRSDRILMVGHIERFNPIVRVAENVVRTGGLRVLSFTAERLGPGPAGNYTLNLGVGHDLLVHDVDIANLFFGDLPRRVYAVAFHTQNFPYEVEVQAMFEYPGARTAQLTASWRTAPNYKRRSFSLRTESSVITVNYILRRIIIDNGIEGFQAENLKTSLHKETIGIELSYQQEEPLKLELLDFLDSVKRRRKPSVSVLEGYIALKCVAKALESAKKGSPIEISWEELKDVGMS